MKPSLSVVMCNYNHGHCIGEALQALVDQSFQPKEIIIVDDGSTDKSVSIIQEYATRYPIIRLLHYTQNRGPIVSGKEALKLASGGYLYCASADDKVLPGFFEKAMQMAQLHPEAGMIFGKVLYTDKEGKIVSQASEFYWSQRLFAAPEVFLKELLGHEFEEGKKIKNALTPAVIFRQQALQEIGGFRPELGYFCDNFAMRAIGLKYGVCFIPDFCVMFKVVSDSFSQSYQDKPKAMLDIGARAVWLMKSAELKDRFPEEYVQKWKKMYRDWVIKTSVIRFSRRFDHALDYLKSNYDFNDWPHKALGFCFLSSMKVCIYLLMLWVKITLIGYSGDISEYRNQ